MTKTFTHNCHRMESLDFTKGEVRRLLNSKEGIRTDNECMTEEHDMKSLYIRKTHVRNPEDEDRP